LSAHPKAARIGQVGEGTRKITEQIDKEHSIEGGIGIEAAKPVAKAASSERSKHTITSSGEVRVPEYAIHVDICGDQHHPAWRIKSAKEGEAIGHLE
jgi:hypothetical protein